MQIMKNLLFKILIVLIVVTAIAAVVIFSLVDFNNANAKISGRFVGLNADMVYLEKTKVAGGEIVDSVALDQDGYYQLDVKDLPETPSLYHVIYNKGRIPLLISRGENIELKAMGNVLMSYTVSGSRESELLRIFNKEFIDGQFALDKIVRKYRMVDSLSMVGLDQQYSATYHAIKRKQIAFIIEHKASLAALYALYQRLPGDQHLTNIESDLIYYRTVLDAVSVKYPSSPFLLSLSNDIASLAARISLKKEIELRAYPELNGRDMYGNEVKLSSLDGNIILVDFWSAELGNSNIINADLKEIYERYKPHGFRVYQVSADISKVTWITAVQGQRLPWISVCDFAGEMSQMLRAYNVQRLPTNYLIDRNGNIIAKNLYGKALEHRLAQMFK
jgi:hypothetical protein